MSEKEDTYVMHEETLPLSERFIIYNSIEKFKPFQVELMELLAKHKKVAVSVGTGLGKTTMMKYIGLDFLDLDKDYKCLILINTRALSFDIQQSIEEILENTEKNNEKSIFCNLCNYNIKNQITSDIIEKARFFIGTPAKYLKLINKLPKSFTFLCIDEIDALLDNQESDAYTILQILDEIKYSYSLVCTATMTDKVQRHVIDRYKYEYRNYSDPIIDIPLKWILYNKKSKDWYIYVCDKIYFIIEQNILKKKVIVFCNYRNDCEKLYNEYRRSASQNNYCIHGNMPSEQIQLYYNQYKQNGKILFTTDMSQRGLDIKDIDIIFHIGVTNETDLYHRNGRTIRRESSNPLCYVFVEECDMNNPIVKNNNEEKFNN